MPPRASLVEDAGAAAASPSEFFRSPPFLASEGVTHSLAIEGESWSETLPVIVRAVPGTDRLDAISPYGYPGAEGPPGSPPAPGEVDWSETGLVSVFVRDRIGGPHCLAEGTERARVQIADPGRESGVRKRLGQQIRRNERRGWSVVPRHGPEVTDEERTAFERAYAETMARTGAAERSWLLLAARGDEPPAAGAIAAVSDGYLHYYLGGTAAEALADSPMKNLFAGMIELAEELGMPLHLGGGVSPGDSLDEFKRGFANGTEGFITHEVVCDYEAYEELAGGDSAPEGFFPAYRATSIARAGAGGARSGWGRSRGPGPGRCP
jgi:hypothetical protein